MNYKQVVEQLEGGNAIRRIDPFAEQATLDKLFRKIDPAYLFAEIPTLWVSRKRGYPSVLIYGVTIYDVRDAEGVKKALETKLGGEEQPKNDPDRRLDPKNFKSPRVHYF